MSIPEFNNLFHDSGPQEILDFLLSKIEANDVSLEEALAMLSVVHKELGEGTEHDPKAFQSYNNFMKFLQREKPELYNYVASAWKQRSENASSVEKSQNVNLDEIVTNVSNLQNGEVRIDLGFEKVKAGGEVSTEIEDPQESGEVEEKPIIEAGKNNEIEEKPNEEEKVEEQDEAADDVSEDSKGKAEEQDDAIIDVEYDAPEEKGSDEGQEEEPEKEGTEEAQELGENDTNLSEVDQNEENDASNNELEKNEIGSEKEAEQGDTEWPAIEESTSEEPLNGIDGEEGNLAAED